MKSDASLTRRDFVAATTTAATALVTTPFRVFARDATENRFKIIGFTKPFQRLNFEDTPDVVAEIGWDGMVDQAFFKWLKTTSFAGPICRHHEYDHGEGKPMIAKMKKDLKVLQEWLAA